jgi:3-methyl-2-oxobutanoate hydroxymethyltransferase
MGCIPELGAAPEDNMSAAPRAGNAKVTVPDILSRKKHFPAGFSGARPEPKPKITCLTAYDYPTARLLDEAGVDILLVGDSVGMAVLGYESTLPVTLDEMVHHTRAVRRATRHALLVADMPYGSFHVSLDESVRNAVRLVKEGGAEAVKVEGGERRIELIARLVEAEIPVMGHVGLTPQSVNAMGGFHVQGKTSDAARQVERDARAVEAAGAFAVVLESMPRDLASRITEKLRIPTIGIGAGPDCDGQVLVIHDLLGLGGEHRPKFVRQYANLSAEIGRAVTSYCADVRSGSFPSDAESYHSAAEVREQQLAAQGR